jgi:DNA primase
MAPLSSPQEIIEKISIVDFISNYISLKKIARLSWGICPFHEENTASFVVNDDKKFFYCFGCGTGGNVINFLMKQKEISFPMAIKELCQKYNLQYKIGEYQSYTQRFNREQEEKIIDFFKSFTNICNQKLMLNIEALKYLEERGVNAPMIRTFKIGYDNGSLEEMIELGYDLSVLKQYGIAKEEDWGYSKFANRLVLPITNASGAIISLSSRALDTNITPKYLHSIENQLFYKKTSFFNLHNCIKDYQEIYIVEGFFDMISMINCNISNTIATLGANISDEQVFVLCKYFKTINLIFDGDSAGIKGMLSAANKFLPYYHALRVKFFTLPANEDPGNFFKNNSLQQLMPLSLEEFLWQYSIKEKDLILDASSIVKMYDNMNNILKQIDKQEEKASVIHSVLQSYWKRKIQTMERKIHLNYKKNYSPLPTILSKEKLICALIFHKSQEILSVIDTIANLEIKDSKLYNIYNKMIRVALSYEDNYSTTLKEEIIKNLSTEEQKILTNPQLEVIITYETRSLAQILQEEF